MRDFSNDHRWLSINTATVRQSRGVDLPLPDIIEACARRGIRAISPWRDQVAAAGLATISRLVKAHGLELSGYCRGGMFPATDEAGRQAAREDNRRAVDEACELNAALPGAGGGRLARRRGRQGRAQGHCAGPRPGARRHCGTAGLRPGGAHAAGHRAAAPDVCRRSRLHQHPGAGAGRLRRTRPATRAAPTQATAAPRWAWPSTSTTCGGTRNCRPRSSARAGTACWPSTSATGSRRPPTCSTTGA